MEKNEMTKEQYQEFNNEIARLKAIKWQGYNKTIKEIGFSYLGSVAQSAKLKHSKEHKVSTYCLYLASSDLSGYNVCPESSMCRDNCLVGSGHAKIDELTKRAGKKARNGIMESRILKTRLFFANREVFMRILMHEIEKHRKKALAEADEFSVRLNGTSDISPLAFTLEGKNILEIYPDIQFYDYTKVPSRIKVAEDYSNYDITWSVDGSPKNKEIALDWLKKGGHVAVVFGTTKIAELPQKWNGYNVVCGDFFDFRYYDGNNVVGLIFKTTANNYQDGKFILPRTEFIVMPDAPECEGVIDLEADRNRFA